MSRDPVQPGLGARFAPEAAELAVDDQEDVLGSVVQGGRADAHAAQAAPDKREVTVVDLIEARCGFRLRARPWGGSPGLSGTDFKTARLSMSLRARANPFQKNEAGSKSDSKSDLEPGREPPRQAARLVDQLGAVEHELGARPGEPPPPRAAPAPRCRRAPPSPRRRRAPLARARRRSPGAPRQAGPRQAPELEAAAGEPASSDPAAARSRRARRRARAGRCRRRAVAPCVLRAEPGRRTATSCSAPALESCFEVDAQAGVGERAGVGGQRQHDGRTPGAASGGAPRRDRQRWWASRRRRRRRCEGCRRGRGRRLSAIDRTETAMATDAASASSAQVAPSISRLPRTAGAPSRSGRWSIVSSLKPPPPLRRLGDLGFGSRRRRRRRAACRSDRPPRRPASTDRRTTSGASTESCAALRRAGATAAISAQSAKRRETRPVRPRTPPHSSSGASYPRGDAAYHAPRAVGCSRPWFVGWARRWCASTIRRASSTAPSGFPPASRWCSCSTTRTASSIRSSCGWRRGGRRGFWPRARSSAIRSGGWR